jgi:hypothetical protein
MKPYRKKDTQTNYFGNLPTTHLYAQIKDGKLIDVETEKEVILKDGALVKIVTILANINDDDYEKYAKEKRKKVLPLGAELLIKMPYQNQQFSFKLILKEDLYFSKKLNKEAVAEKCKIEVVEMYDGHNAKNKNFIPFETNSLNQAFFQASVKYRPNNRSHNANIYENCFLPNGEAISLLRF